MQFLLHICHFLALSHLAKLPVQEGEIARLQGPLGLVARLFGLETGYWSSVSCSQSPRMGPLAYSYYHGYVFEKSDCIVRPLESVSNTVERLSVGLDHYPVLFNERDFNETEVSRYEHVQEALKKFTRLKTVELPICLLVSYDVYPENDVDLSTIWPDTLCEVGLRIDMKAGHENEWDELRMVDWVYDVLLKQRDAVPHLQWIIIRFWEPFYDDLWQEDEKRLQAKCEEIGSPFEFMNDDLSRRLWMRTISWLSTSLGS